MDAIAVGCEEEYGKRLVNYLETHLPKSIRMFRFTNEKTFLDWSGEADLYLFTECFSSSLPKEEMEGKEIILIVSGEKEGCYCSYHAPGELLEMILKKQDGGRWDKDRDQTMQKSQITAVYSPIYDCELKFIAMQLMGVGAVYLGMEDLGCVHRDRADMGDLCYYIHLREERIMEQLKGLLSEQENRYYLDSPNWYFDLRELSWQDYQWFFEKVREQNVYQKIFVGIGSSFAWNSDYFQFFDKLILLDAREDESRHAFCERLEILLGSKEHFAGTFERIYREDILYVS